jgi:hypothetical protein
VVPRHSSLRDRRLNRRGEAMEGLFWNLTTKQVAVCLLLISCGTAVVIIPFAHYLVAGWRAKRKDIMDGFDAKARLEYFKMFCRGSPIPTPENASAEFTKFHAKWYGRRYFIVPGLLLLTLSFTMVSVITLTGLDRLQFLSNPLLKMPDTAMAAMAGAYLWVGNDLTSRARRLDFSPADVMWAVLRLSLAVPMGYAFAAVAAKSLGPFVAFALGAFPLSTLTSMLQRVANKNLGLEAAASETTDDIIKLQGINRAIVERLSSEDINTITQVAYCDPVRLIMRSNLTFNFVTDCMNQALAWMYLQGDLDIIRPLGMRGAVEIGCLIEELDDVDAQTPLYKADHERAVSAFPLIAAAIKQEPVTLQLVLRQIAGDPYSIFLKQVWK